MKTLRNRPASEAEYLLATAIATLAPSAFPRDVDETRVSIEAIIREAGEQVQATPPFDESQKVRILDVLTSELQRRMVTPERQRAARTRLGARGLLRNSDYTVVIHEDCRPHLKKFKISVEEVLRVVQTSNSFYHLLPWENDPSYSLSVFVSAQASTPPKSRLLVLTVRKGDQQAIWSAWRVAEDDFLPLLHRPREFFIEFADRFCVDFSLFGKGPWRLMLRETITPPRHSLPVEPDKLINVFEVSYKDRGSVQGSVLARISHLGVLQVMVAIFIDNARYLEYLKQKDLLR
jgi:hypothetical protein